MTHHAKTHPHVTIRAEQLRELQSLSEQLHERMAQLRATVSSVADKQRTLIHQHDLLRIAAYDLLAVLDDPAFVTTIETGPQYQIAKAALAKALEAR